jgi:hypothetical protein
LKLYAYTHYVQELKKPDGTAELYKLHTAWTSPAPAISRNGSTVDRVSIFRLHPEGGEFKVCAHLHCLVWRKGTRGSWLACTCVGKVLISYRLIPTCQHFRCMHAHARGVRPPHSSSAQRRCQAVEGHFIATAPEGACVKSVLRIQNKAAAQRFVATRSQVSRATHQSYMNRPDWLISVVFCGLRMPDLGATTGQVSASVGGVPLAWVQGKCVPSSAFTQSARAVHTRHTTSRTHHQLLQLNVTSVDPW